MITNLNKCPFPWFGGKRDASPQVWQALGDVAHYVEPFAGSLAVLLTRPHPANRTYYSETVNDVDGLLVNWWRAVTADPGAVADAASWPVTEVDKHARSCALLQWRETEMVALLAGGELPDWRVGDGRAVVARRHRTAPQVEGTTADRHHHPRAGGAGRPAAPR